MPRGPCRSAVPVVGLVGTVCSGKSTVARMMAEDGLEVVDADKIGHEVLERPEVKTELRRTFGDDVFGPDGAVDRARLGRLVFGCQARLDRLNEIVHRPMLKEIDRRVRRAAERAGGRPVVLDMALLIEKGLHEKYCDLLVFVDAPVAVRQGRAQRTRGWSAEELLQRDAAQMAAELKKQQADFVIVNSDTVEELHNAVRVLMDQIRQRLSISPGQAARPNRPGPSQRGRSASGHTHKRR